MAMLMRPPYAMLVRTLSQMQARLFPFPFPYPFRPMFLPLAGDAASNPVFVEDDAPEVESPDVSLGAPPLFELPRMIQSALR